jgi:hypothetical protein
MFTTFELVPGRLLEQGALRVHGLGGRIALSAESTYWVLVTGGTCTCSLGEDSFVLRQHRFAVLSEPGELAGGDGMVIELAGYHGLRQLGGPLEPSGRLRYVDGCSDTLLAAPPRLGEPCLNHLHIPAHTLQSRHTHDSLRVGVIARGHGVCRTDAGDHPLREGLGWLIPTGLSHCFYTAEQALDVFAFHPDSDYGPTDGCHPMINRTNLER